MCFYISSQKWVVGSMLMCVPIFLVNWQTTFCQKLSWEMEYGAFNMIPKANDKVCDGKSWHPPQPKKAHMLKSQMKTVLITFFSIKDIYCSHWIYSTRPNSQPSLLHGNTEAVHRRRPEVWPNRAFHSNSGPAHKALYQAVPGPKINYWNRTPKHPPYSPDLSPNDLWLFPEIKSALKGWRFNNPEDIQKNMMMSLKAVP
jgi:hypothetical protein